MKKKSILIFALIFVMLFGNTLAVSASVPNLSSNKYIKTYPLSTSNNTYVYTSASLTKRGTSYPYKAYNAVIYASDEIYVYSMNNTYAYVSYPTSSGRRYGYIKTSAITRKNKNLSSTYTSRAKINTYKKAGGAYYGYIAKGDTVYTVASSGNYVQVIYPTGLTYKMGWITVGNYNKYIAKGGSSNSGGNTSSNSSVKVSLNVPNYKQYDSRWKNKCIGNHTIGSIGCLLTSCAMKYSYQTGTTTYPTAMKNKLRFSNNDLIWSSVSNVGFRYTKQYNCNINNSIMKTIYQQLKAGKPVIIGGRSARGGYHFVVVTGYRGSSATSFKASDFTIHDPNSSSRTTLSQFTAVYYKINRLVY